MAHIMLLYALPDHKFARQLAVQLEQRGLVVWPVPEVPPDEDKVLVFTLHADVLEASLTNGATGLQCAQLINNIVDILTCDTCDGIAP